MKKLLSAGLLFFALIPTAHAGDPPQAAEFVLSAAVSMNEQTGGLTRLESLRKGLAALAPEIAPGVTAFRTFGEQTGSCESRLHTAPVRYDRLQFLTNLHAFTAFGRAGLAQALSAAAQDLSSAGQGPKAVFLAADGGDDCDGNLNQAIDALKTASVKAYVLGLKPDRKAEKQLRKIAEETGGKYAAAANPEETARASRGLLEAAGLLRAQEKDNLLSSEAGALMMAKDSKQFERLIDGKEEMAGAFFAGQKAVLAFQSKKPVLLERFAVPIFESSAENPRVLELFGSLESPAGDFFPVRVVTVENKVSTGRDYDQSFPIEPPVALRYLKVVIGAAQEGQASMMAEWKAYGRFLSDEEALRAGQAALSAERDVIAAHHGARLLTWTEPALQFLNDGTGADPGMAAEVAPGAEAVFAFYQDRAALLKKIAVPFLTGIPSELESFELWTSENDPAEGFKRVGIYQITKERAEWILEPPVKARYLKFRALGSAGEGSIRIPELQVTGTLESA